jgi:broad specificity phosphatase PhoE
MTDVVLVRHGETVSHAENRYAGSSDVDLTPRGVDQAGRLAGWAHIAGLDGIWTSPLVRARRTAEPAAKTSGSSLAVDDRLRELDFGAGEGLTAAEMTRNFPAARAAFDRDPVGHHLPGGEDPVAAAARFVACLRDITTRHPDGRALVVTHSTVIRLALCSLLGVPLSRYRRLFPSLANCALTELRLRGDDVAMLRYNTPVDSMAR